MKKFCKFMRLIKKMCRNQQIYAKIKKNVRGTSITIYYTYKSPVYVYT